MTAPSLPPRFAIRPAVVIVLRCVALGIAVLVTALTGRDGSTPPVTAPTLVAVDQGELYVHVLGAVLVPGLYELNAGDRAVDAVAAAGGFAEGADQTQLNLARLLVDGEQIVVPLLGETAPAAASDGRVNLNPADQAALETLPRVGPALAQRISTGARQTGASLPSKIC